MSWNYQGILKKKEKKIRCNANYFSIIDAMSGNYQGILKKKKEKKKKLDAMPMISVALMQCQGIIREF